VEEALEKVEDLARGRLQVPDEEWERYVKRVAKEAIAILSKLTKPTKPEASVEEIKKWIADMDAIGTLATKGATTEVGKARHDEARKIYRGILKYLSNLSSLTKPTHTDVGESDIVKQVVEDISLAIPSRLVAADGGEEVYHQD
jgi:hypothetical protein